MTSCCQLKMSTCWNSLTQRPNIEHCRRTFAASKSLLLGIEQVLGPKDQSAASVAALPRERCAGSSSGLYRLALSTKWEPARHSLPGTCECPGQVVAGR